MKFSGRVIKGLGRGEKTGFHTMNLNPKRVPVSLVHGIYAVRVKTPIGSFNGVAHFGPRPTHGAGISFEVHAFGLRKNIWRKNVEVEIVEPRIRTIRHFKSEKALTKAIQSDIAKAKKCL